MPTATAASHHPLKHHPCNQLHAPRRLAANVRTNRSNPHLPPAPQAHGNPPRTARVSRAGSVSRPKVPKQNSPVNQKSPTSGLPSPSPTAAPRASPPAAHSKSPPNQAAPPRPPSPHLPQAPTPPPTPSRV